MQESENKKEDQYEVNHLSDRGITLPGGSVYPFILSFPRDAFLRNRLRLINKWLKQGVLELSVAMKIWKQITSKRGR